MYRVLLTVLTAGALAGAQNSQDSGLTQLINPGSQGPYPSAPASQPAPYPPAPAPYPPATSYSFPTENQGFTVQSGYEGFILPTGPAPEPHSALHGAATLGGVALGASLLKHFLPFPFNKIAHVITTKIGLWILGFVLITLIGGAATTAVCAFTPLCTISFLGFGRESARAFFTQDRIDMLTQFVHDALDKYKKLQSREGKSLHKAEPKTKKYHKEQIEAEEHNAVLDASDKTKESREVKVVKQVEEIKHVKKVIVPEVSEKLSLKDH